ncbi:hypothetical protein CDO51_09550 [Natranaerobius trueperi]|uniref:Uncharacterized protein n=1 Tax=Natranaerobius trueperi TaxID=759412 RepID=A0A226BWK0_9FIRM|nr:hypothetical protein CDO51_09550 [Natranaerobius trueperi]
MTIKEATLISNLSERQITRLKKIIQELGSSFVIHKTEVENLLIPYLKRLGSALDFHVICTVSDATETILGINLVL